MSDVKELVKRTVGENALLDGGGVVVVAVSGGADSVALLTVLADIKDEYDLELVVAHFNHRLRGAASDGDEAFVSSMASARGLLFRSACADVGKEAGLRGASVEETAREMRYGFLVGLAREVGAGKVAIGHTADDLAETFLMRLLRGSGLGGLVPMEPMMEREGVTVVRPLLDVPHAQVIRCLKGRGIPYRLDRSNFSSSYFRNKIRHELVPLLEAAYNPSIRDVLSGTSRGLSVIKSYIDGEVAGACDRCVEAKGDAVYLRLNGLHPAMASGVARSALRSCGAPYSHEKIARILSIALEGRGSVDLGRSFSAVAEGDRVVIVRDGGRARGRPPVDVAVPGATDTEGIVVETSFVKRARVKRGAVNPAGRWMRACAGERVSFEAYMDYGSLKAPLVLRTRLPGDRFQPTGMRGTKKLKEIFIDEKVPERIRDGIPLLACGDEIAWVVGYRAGERFKVRPSTAKILRIKVTVEEQKI